MEPAAKIMFGKLLGEIYRTQEMLKEGASATGRDHIYGLLKGIESVVDQELESVGFISNEKMQAALEVLSSIFYDEEKMATFRGYYQIEGDLEERGVTRSDAIKIFTYLKADGRYSDLFDKMKSGHSPAECHEFAIPHWVFPEDS